MSSRSRNVYGSTKIAGAMDDYAYWLRNKIKHGDHTEEEHALLEVVSKEFYDRLGEML